MQEDASIANGNFDGSKALFGVFDGHGGGEVAAYVKRHFEDILTGNDKYKAAEFKEGMRTAFLQVDEKLLAGGLEEVGEIKRLNPPKKPAIFQALTAITQMKDGKEGESEEEKEAESLKTIGCTANVVMLDYQRSKIFVANAGDSRSVMGRAGKAVPLSFDHKPEEEEEIRRIEAAGS